jgi:hypothetical protein
MGIMELGNLLFGHSRGEFPIERIDEFEEPLFKLIEKINGESTCYTNPYKNNVFVIRPYWWGECDCGALDYEPHTDSCSLILPNFEHFKSDLKVMWYKYPLRDSYANREITLNEWTKIMKECYNSCDPLDWLDKV